MECLSQINVQTTRRWHSILLTMFDNDISNFSSRHCTRILLHFKVVQEAPNYNKLAPN